MTKDEALKLALEALEDTLSGDLTPYQAAKTITAIREALAQPEHGPVACIGTNGELMWLNKPKVVYSKPIPLYTTPPQRKPLPEGEWPKHPSGYVGDVYKGYYKSDLDNYAMQVLAAHGIKGPTS